jgi:superfamily II DNA or RNA helicase
LTDRTPRQKECVKKWILNKCIGSLVLPTGFGKSRTAILGWKTLLKKFPDLKVIVVVPTETLQAQWENLIAVNEIDFNYEVVIINSAIKHEWNCDLLILDEVHLVSADTFKQVFVKIHYKYILALTATFERLDGKHKIAEHFCPIVDQMSLEEAILNGWVSTYTEYKVVLNVSDIDVYKQYNKEFNTHFEFFNYKFEVAMSMIGPEGYKNRAKLIDEMCRNNPKLDRTETFKAITYHATGLSRALQARKQFIYNHPDKVRLTREIINNRPFSKIITFSATAKVAESIGIGKVYTGKDSKKKGRQSIEEFIECESGVLNTCKKADAGLDVKGLSVGIILGMDSSPIKTIQRTGRVIRLEENKQPEIFTFVINQTVEESWFAKSHEGLKYITIDEENLMKVLRGEAFDTYKAPITNFMFRV